MCHIPDDNVLNFSSHLSAIFSITIDEVNNSYEPKYTGHSINWQKGTSEHVKLYKDFTKYDETFHVLIEHNMSTTNDIDSFCEKFTEHVNNAANICFPKQKSKTHLKPYWDSELKTDHFEMLTARRSWLENGRTRDPDDTTYRKYKNSKRGFRKQHWIKCKQYIDTIYAFNRQIC